MLIFYRNKNVVLFHAEMRVALDSLPAESIDTVITDPPYGLRFMGKRWDYDVPSCEQWRSVLRVMKPGAMLLCFGGTRTYHRVIVNIEDAGFEIRDCVMWLYGSGFPKSLDISKAIDKAAGAEHEVVETLNRAGSTGHGQTIHQMGGDKLGVCAITAPATDAAREWDGWGTALKPAYEPICVAMKPLDGTFADNALKYGVAGMNIDGARVGTNDTRSKHNVTIGGKGIYCGGAACETGSPQGRWPANVIHDGSSEVVAGMPKPHGAGREREANNGTHAGPSGMWGLGEAAMRFGDTGSAARFFYCAKASRQERDRWLEQVESVTREDVTGRKVGSAGSDNPRAGVRRYGQFHNDHPTVKPIDLMRYLCRLTATPRGGTVLDPWCGSGSTLIAARIEGRRAIGVDKDERACRLTAARCEGQSKEYQQGNFFL